MTTDVKLLPLPRTLQHADDADLAAHVQDYARANVANATAAKDAEIEALRAEVAELRAARIAYASEFPATADGDPDTGNIHANIRALKARAERLAEAIKAYKSECDNPAKDYVLRAKRRDEMFALLHDHDQEGKDG